jgi:hypothetical protein
VNFRNLPPVKSISNSLVDDKIFPGYSELMQYNDWNGPYKLQDTFYICQISPKTKQGTGWILLLSKSEIELFEIANNQKKGYYRWIGETMAHEYHHQIIPAKKIRNWRTSHGGRMNSDSKR